MKYVKATWDYQQTKIYRIRNNDTGKEYIGHTTYEYLSQRLRQHRAKYTSWLSGKEVHQSSFDVLDKDPNKYEIILIEHFPCQDVYEARRRERYWIEQRECVNTTIPSRTKQEIDREWREKNVITIQCECGGSYQTHTGKKERHEASKKHQYWVEHGVPDTRTTEEKKLIYRESNKQKTKEYFKKYVEEHAEELKEKRQKYYEEHREEIIERASVWYENNKERKAEYDRNYRRKT